MLINARDLRQWTYLRNLPQKKKKTLVLTLGNPPEKGGEKKTLVLTLGRSSAYTANLPEKGKKIKIKNRGINPGQPAGKGREKKTMVLTLGSPLEKGGKKKPW
jgi:hypothetical protein